MDMFFQVPNANEKEQLELLEILDCFFDPEKKPIQPKPRVYNDDRPRKPRFNKNKAKGENKNISSESANETIKIEETTTAVVPTPTVDTAIAAH